MVVVVFCDNLPGHVVVADHAAALRGCSQKFLSLADIVTSVVMMS